MAKDWKSRFTGENIKREGINAACVTLGLLSATMLDRLVQKGAEKFLPAGALPYVGAIKAFVSIAGGLTLSLMKDESHYKMIGYGITASGALSGLRLIPGVDNLLSGVQSVAGLPPAETLLGLNLGSFGASDNIRSIATSDAEQASVELPDLGRGAATQTYEARVMQYEPAESFEEITAEFI